MFDNNFWKTLGQKRIQAFVGAAVAYSDSPTYDHFIANAVEGEIGFYDESTKALISGAIGATVRFFVALKRGGRTYKSTSSLRSEVTPQKVAYAAPQFQVIDIAAGSRATLTLQNIVYTARTGGTGGNSVTVANVASGNNTPLSIGVSVNAITVNLATNGGGASISTGAQVLAALKASTTAMGLVNVSGTGTMSTVQSAASATNLAGGAAGTAPTAGDTYSIEIIDMTTATQPFPSYMYSYKVKTGDTLTTVATQLAAMVNDTVTIPNRDRDLIVTASTNADRLTLTGKAYGTTFKVLVRDAYANVAAAYQVQPTKVGAGYYAQVQYLEAAGDIFAGVTTNYPENHATPDEFGKPVSLVSSANTYNMYQWTKIPFEASRTPNNQWTPGLVYFSIAVPSNGTNPSSAIDTALGVS